jgi:hypothetical protein
MELIEIVQNRVTRMVPGMAKLAYDTKRGYRK